MSLFAQDFLRRSVNKTSGFADLLKRRSRATISAMAIYLVRAYLAGVAVLLPTLVGLAAVGALYGLGSTVVSVARGLELRFSTGLGALRSSPTAHLVKYCSGHGLFYGLRFCSWPLLSAFFQICVRY